MPVGERPVPAGRLAPPRSTRRVLTKGRQVWAQWPPAAFLSCRVPRSLPPRAPPLRRYCPSAMLASRSSAREERDTTATPTTVKGSSSWGLHGQCFPPARPHKICTGNFIRRGRSAWFSRACSSNAGHGLLRHGPEASRQPVHPKRRRMRPSAEKPKESPLRSMCSRSDARGRIARDRERPEESRLRA